MKAPETIMLSIIAILLGVIILMTPPSYSESIEKLSQSGEVKIVNQTLQFTDGDGKLSRKELEYLHTLSKVYNVEIVTLFTNNNF